MADPKFKSGDLVTAIGTKVLENGVLWQEFPDTWRTVVVTGRVQGRGSGRKTVVQWTIGSRQIVSEVGARVLTATGAPAPAGGPVQAPPPPPSDSPSDSEPDHSDMDISEDEGAVDGDDGPCYQDYAAPGEPLNPGGLTWIFECNGIALCARECSQTSWKFQPKLNWPRKHNIHNKTLKPLDYWLLLFPDMLDCVVKWTNASMGEGTARTSKHEIVKFFGIMYSMTLYPSRQRKDYWSLQDSKLFPAPAFGQRFGMSRNRFTVLVKRLKMYDPALDAANPQDPWRAIRTFIDEFNNNRRKTVTPGWVCVVDESTTKWRGLGDWYELGMPHITKIPRKPEPVGLEIKDLCDGESGIMLFIEIMEGVQIMTTKPFCARGRKDGTAQCLRFTQSWHGSGRVLVGDSAFASVQTCIEMMKVAGWYFVGLVKQSSAMYPKRHLQTMQMGQRGNVATFTATRSGVTMLAHVWNDPGKPGKPRKSLISTFGTSTAAEASQRRRKRKRDDGTWEDYFKPVPRSELVKTYFTYAGAIDRHNRVRMDGIRMERTLEFKEWHRRVVTSLLGYVATDAFYGMKLEQGDDLQLDEFMEELAKSMIFNHLPGCPPDQLAEGMELRHREQADKEIADVMLRALDHLDSVNSSGDQAIACKHNISSVTRLPGNENKKKATLTCAVCKIQGANFYCVDCSAGQHTKTVAICGPVTGRQCLSIHCAT